MEARISNRAIAKQWQDAGNLILGIWLFISPWVFGLPFMIQSVAAAFWLVGAIACVNSAIALFRGSFGEAEWINLIAGIVMFLVAINRQMPQALMLNGLIVGIVMFILALWGIIELRHA
jgi:hypothetical protein